VPKSFIPCEDRYQIFALTEAKVFMQNIPSILAGGQLIKTQYQNILQSIDTEELYHRAHLLM
jgi:hypothetical protein